MKQRDLRILYVEDDEDDYILMRDMISEVQDIQITLDWMRDGVSALEAMQENNHDICLLDYLLGPSNGLELMEEAIYKGCKSPVIFLTGQDDREVDLAAMQAGAADYLVKGRFDVPLLERSIRYAFERAKLLNQLNELAIRDDLTGLYNRREMNRLLEEEFERHQRHRSPLSVIMADVDHFKRVNDRFGHVVGDQVLRWLAQIIRLHVRTLDRPVRYGGEEFAIILPETSAQGACQVAERLRQVIAAQPYLNKHEESERCQSISITISMGVAEIPGDIGDVAPLIQTADQALYAAKRAGRNRVMNYRSMGR